MASIIYHMDHTNPPGPIDHMDHKDHTVTSIWQILQKRWLPWWRIIWISMFTNFLRKTKGTDGFETHWPPDWPRCIKFLIREKVGQSFLIDITHANLNNGHIVHCDRNCIDQFQYHITFCIGGVGVISLIKEVNIHSKEEAVLGGKHYTGSD